MAPARPTPREADPPAASRPAGSAAPLQPPRRPGTRLPSLACCRRSCGGAGDGGRRARLGRGGVPRAAERGAVAFPCVGELCWRWGPAPARRFLFHLLGPASLAVPGDVLAAPESALGLSLLDTAPSGCVSQSLLTSRSGFWPF